MKVNFLSKVFTNKIAAIFLILIFSMLYIHANVTIGTNAIPGEGALLDLKETDVSDASANSNKGIVFPRVWLPNENELYPMFTGGEANYSGFKLTHTGMAVYNLNNIAPFNEGLYFWTGNKWIPYLSAILAENGLYNPNDYSVGLGGALSKDTEIALDTYKLNLSTSSGSLGINQPNPGATVHIKTLDTKDPLIIDTLKFISEPINVLDDANSIYYNVVISSKGVVRKVEPLTNIANSAFYELATDFNVANGAADGSGGTIFNWKKDGVTGNFSNILLPQDGAYIFSFRLYGTVGGLSGQAASYYISAFKGDGTTFTLYDIAEMMIIRVDKAAATYSINLSITGKEGEYVQFKIGMLNSSTVTWNLKTGNSFNANRTSMLFWKI